MKGFLQEYGIIMVVVAVVLGMLAFGKTGYAKGIQNAILGSANHIVETGENITKKEVHVTAGDTLDIEGTKYVVLEEQEKGQALVMTADSIGMKRFQSTARSDGQNQNTYEGSELDNYLENDWYNSLSSSIKAAIQTTSIKQSSIKKTIYGNHDEYEKQETGYNGQVYNTISRHVFLPSVDEIGKAVDFNNKDKVKAFLNGIYIYTRDSCDIYNNHVKNVIMLNGEYGKLDDYDVNYSLPQSRPAFVIDLSKIDYKVAGHVDYK